MNKMREAFEKWDKFTPYKNPAIRSAFEAGYQAAIDDAAPVIPAGWVMVPVEPTPLMVDSTWDERLDVRESHNARNKRIYKAMLSAAPKGEGK